VIGLVLKH